MTLSTTSTIGFLLLCLECSLLLNAAAALEAELGSSLLSRASEWDCASDDDCTVSNSSCVNGNCECDGGYMYNTDMTDCLLAATAYGDECTETIQCSTYLLTGSVCASGVCTCSEGYHYTRGRCYASAGLGEACAADVNCYVWADNGAASCVNSICACSDGFYAREHRTCRRAGYAVGDECAIDLDCQFENGYCDTTGLDAYSYVCALHAADDTTTVTSVDTTTSAGDTTTVGSDDATTTSSDDTTTVTSGDTTTSAGDTTTVSSDDTTTVSSDDTTTVTSVDTTTSAGDTTTTSSTPDDTTTVSSADTTTESVDENATVGTVCVSNENCTTLANSKCGSAGTCVCNRAYFPSDDFRACIPEIGEDCDSDDYAGIEYSLCRNGTWSCGHAAVTSIDQQICRKTTRNYNWSCLYDEQCHVFGPDAKCQEKRCLCNENSHLVEELSFCWISRGISQSCIADEDCYVANLNVELSCTNTVCTCPNGTSPNSDNTLCKNDNAVLGGVCEEEDDCTVANSACIDSICGCPANYFVTDDYCGAGYNATCSSDGDCAVGNSTCTGNNRCGCAEDFVVDAADSCLPVKSYGAECESDVQCLATLDHAHCATSDQDSTSNVTSNCQCEPNYHYRFGLCYRKTEIGGTCTSLGDCYVESGIEEVVCRSGVCNCRWDATGATTTSCRTQTSDATTFFLLSWMSLLLLGLKIFLV